jgi:sigma-B regulation protein RsbU (phosphoserine phosphatase)
MSIVRAESFAGSSPIGAEQPMTPRTILVVDDSRVQRRILAASLTRWGYEVFEAGCGHEALDLLAERHVDIVLSDWMMPGMDGAELCQALRRQNRPQYSYFILLTSKTDKEDVAAGLDVGADDFLTKPVTNTELRARLTAGQRILAMTEELIEKNAKLQAVNDALDRDLEEARRLQQALVPDRYLDVGTGRIAILMRPSGHVGGDLVGRFRIGDGRMAIFSIDVSGHGVASALMTARLASYLSNASPEQNIAITRDERGVFGMRPPHEVCAMLNELLLREMDTDLYFTMCLAEIDLKSGRVRLAQAGHPNPAILRAGGRVESVDRGGLPIGLISGATYETQEVRLGPCDRLLIYSDGITECEGSGGEQFGEARLAQSLGRTRRQPPPAMLETLVGDLERFAGTTEFDDDVSAVLFQYDGMS